MSNCKDCKSRLFLTSLAWYDVCVDPDQEPYDAGVEEKVQIDGHAVDEVIVEMHATAHVCPVCKIIRDIEINEDY